jgi:pyruvate dehydrogenase phosphatase
MASHVSRSAIRYCVRFRAYSTGTSSSFSSSHPTIAGSFALSASACSYPANNPSEDRYFFHRHGDLVLAGLADGHGGFQCSMFLQQALPAAFSAELEHATTPTDVHQIAPALVRAFERVDRDFIGRLRPAFHLGFGSLGSVGACAIAAVITPTHVIVANAGDCRAVLGHVRAIKQIERESSAVTVEAVALSEDHNCRMPREQAQLRIAHPAEADVFVLKPGSFGRTFYIKGRLQPTRSIGDPYLKHSEFNAPWAAKYIPPPYSPPYITGGAMLMRSLSYAQVHNIIYAAFSPGP